MAREPRQLLSASLQSAQRIASGVKFAGWIPNSIEPDMLALEENIQTLAKRLGALYL